MSPLTLLLLIAVMFSLLYLLDTLARSIWPLSYLYTLRALGLEVSLFQVRWETERFNGPLGHLARMAPRLARYWFSLGSLVCSLLVLPCMILLVFTLNNQVQDLVRDKEVPQPQQQDRLVLRPLVPGLNLPPSELMYYVISLAVCSVFHETGHALAALDSQVSINCCGLLLFFVLPAAFVDLPTDLLTSRPSLAQLRVFSAGVWHNVVLAALFCLLGWGLPTITSPLYLHRAGGLVVVEVKEGTSVSGPGGLNRGDIVTRVQGREVSSIRDYKVMLASLLGEQGGICVDRGVVEDLRVGTGCCSAEMGSNLCFREVQGEGVCLPVRSVVESSRVEVLGAEGTRRRELLSVSDGLVMHCNSSLSCGDLSCLVPEFSDNRTRLVILDRREDREFLFVGSPAEIYQHIQLSEYSAVSPLLPLSLPDHLHRLATYMAGLSAGLGVLNLVPSHMLDGGFVIRVLVDIMWRGRGVRTRERITRSLKFIGTSLIVGNILLGLVGLVLSS